MKVIEIKEEEFKEKIKEGKVLIDCYATWCGPCKMLSPIIDELANEIDTYKFYKLDVDNCDEITKEYGIMSIPTILIFENNTLKEKLVGFKSKEELEEILNK
ncbi:MAG: thioredoxin [Bacilli bacterium]|nr:thioredoxin [Bacilli bacterium]